MRLRGVLCQFWEGLQVAIVRVTYELQCDASEVAARSRAIAWEQSVEVPESLIESDALRAEVVGRVESIEPLAVSTPLDAEADSTDTYTVCIAYPGIPIHAPPSLLMNLAFGNVSLLSGIRVTQLQLSDEMLSASAGPQLGVSGLRTLLGVHERPLLATALKPRGASVRELAELAGSFATGGGDLVKDDHNLIDLDFEQFKRRVDACAQAVARARERTGKQTLYLPNLAGPSAELESRLDFLQEVGAGGFLLAPFLIGLDRAQDLVRRHSLLAMSHPSWGGGFLGRTHGLAHDVLLGQVPRLLGFDASVFPNSGGRFGFSRGECRGIADRLREPAQKLRRGWPTPAGGMQLASIPELVREYRHDAILLVGGALLTHSDDLAASAAHFLDAVESAKS